ncbi:MAG: 1-acyl-sn-glycerol-3-phosphate acyltransferase, partial [Steroidobacteraceae bacterium]
MQWLRSLVFTTLLFLDTFLFALLVVLAVPFGLAGRHRVARTWAWLNLLLLRWLCRLDYVVEGRENLPTDGAHISYWKHS